MISEDLFSVEQIKMLAVICAHVDSGQANKMMR